MGSAGRLLNLKLNPAGYMSAAGAVYAAAVMIYNAVHHHGIINVPVIIAAITAVSALFTRQLVTPTGDPHDGAGRKLVAEEDLHEPEPGPEPEPAEPPAGSAAVRILPDGGGTPPG
jgi:hypothetical protein